MAKKLNCWEFKKCGREAGGANASSLGVCPATQERKLDGAHGGMRAGRACWVVAGTLCKGQVQGSFATKYDNCSKCDFYQQVAAEESPRFVLASMLLARMR